jgi:hypothetical protein
VGVEEEVVPALWREEQGGRVTVGRGRLVRYGRLLFAERRVWNEDNWTAGLELHVEVFDRMDGLQMLSARGALLWTPAGTGDMEFGIPALPAVDVRGSSFSAASRDPEQRRFGDIGAYFSQGGGPEYPCSLCVRVTVRDQRTGKGGLLWEEGKGSDRKFQDVGYDWQQPLPEGAKTVVGDETRILGPRGENLQCWTAFIVCPEPDQEGVAEEDRLYYVAMGEDQDSDEGDFHPFRFRIRSTEVSKVGSMIRSLC